MEEKILKMLNDGMSYSTIQETLGVSSKTVAKVKKQYFPSESTEDLALALSDDENERGKHTELTPEQETGKQKQVKTQNQSNMESETSAYADWHYRTDEELELEKLKINRQYDLELAKIEREKLQDTRAHSFKEEELRLEKQRIDQAQERMAMDARQNEQQMDAQRQASKQKRDEETKHSILKQFHRLVENCQEGEWSDSEAEDYNQRLNDLRQVMYKISLSDDSTLVFLTEIRVLDHIIAFFEQIIEDWDEDEIQDIEFDEEFSNKFDTILEMVDPV